MFDAILCPLGTESESTDSSANAAKATRMIVARCGGVKSIGIWYKLTKSLMLNTRDSMFPHLRPHE